MVENLPPLPWVILFAPLVACVLIVLFALKRPGAAAGIALAGIVIPFIASAALCWFNTVEMHSAVATISYDWVKIPGFKIGFGYLIDQMTLVMLLVVTGVGSCVFLYSSSYMKGDTSYPRFFASLSLFAFSMLGIVLADNFLMLFIFWELVAVSSYLLIGFWFEKPSAADAGNKAFIVNRVADFGMVLGIFMVWMLSGMGGAERTFQFQELAHRIPALLHAGTIPQSLFVIAGLLVFCGVVGKSAQFPLYIWLPDAMEGPTPVSALIHAATMVAAGVYMLARVFFLVSGVEAAMTAIAVIGAITLVLAAGLALVQNDIKKILAYSTVSQLGYMVLALGLGGRTEAMFHLTTHAFFKALLFLGAGSMIHALHTQDIWEMGGLRKEMPITSWTFIIGTLALCGIAPLSGFWSKDEILVLAKRENWVLFTVATLGAGLTAFYMTRAVWVAVLGERKKKAKSHGKKAHAHDAHDAGHDGHAHESPLPMTLPLIFLAVLSVTAGFFGLPAFLNSAAEHGAPHGEAVHHGIDWFVAGLSTAVALGGIALGTLLYKNAKPGHDPVVKGLGGLYHLIVKKYYLDDFFSALAGFVQNAVAGVLYRFDVKVVIERGVNGTAALTRSAADRVRRAQTGRVRTYATAFAFGIVAAVYFILLKG